MSAIRKLFAGQTHADGVQLGGTGEKIGFAGAAPVVRPVGAGQGAVALTSVQNATAAAVDLATSEALANALKANYNALQVDVAAQNVLLLKIRTDLVALGLIKGAA